MNRRLLLAGLALFVCGCSANAPQPVEGKIVYTDGSAATDLAGFIVAMDSSEHAAGANGVVQADGTFRVGTYQNDDGALPAKYRVSLTPPDPPLDQPAPKPVINPKYADMGSSGLEVEIKPGKNEVTLTVERAKR